jgi:hypothetical protein
MAGADHRFLDQVRQILADRNAGPRGHQKRDPPRLPEAQRGHRVAIDERLLDGGFHRDVRRHDRLEPVRQLHQPRRQRPRGIGHHDAVGDMGEPPPVEIDHAPPGGPQSRVEPQQPHRVEGPP